MSILRIVPCALALLLNIGWALAAQPKAGDLDVEPIVLKTADGREIRAERGRLAVPENRAKPQCNVIEVAFLRLKSSSPTPGSPLVYLDGGPGGSATSQARSPAALSIWASFLEHADVLLIDQRGVGACRPVLSWQPAMDVPADIFKNRESFVRGSREFCAKMAKHFRDQGVDLTGYTVVEMADDVNDVRAALKVPKISLLGYSFGTHHALAVIRRHGQFIDRAVLIGTEGPSHTRKLPSTYDRQLEAISKLIAEDENVNKDVPDFAALVKRVLQKLEREPIVVTIPHRGKAIDIPVGAFGLQLLMVIDIGDTNDIPVFPRLLHSIDRGDPSILAWFVQKRYTQFQSMTPVFYVCDAASGATQDRWNRIREEAKSAILGNAMNLAFPEVDEIFGTPDLGDAFRAPISSDVPVLYISGTLDSNTPPWQAEEVARGFKNTTLLVIENAGHEDMHVNPQVQETIQQYLRGENIGDVHISLPPPRFIPVEGDTAGLRHPAVR